MRKLTLSLTLTLSLFSCESVPLSKQDAAVLEAIGGAGLGAVTHKHFKTSANKIIHKNPKAGDESPAMIVLFPIPVSKAEPRLFPSPPPQSGLPAPSGSGDEAD